MKKLFVLLMVTLFLGLGSLVAQEKEVKQVDPKKKIEATKEIKKVKKVKAVKKEKSKCDGCKDKAGCTKEEKTK